MTINYTQKPRNIKRIRKHIVRNTRQHIKNGVYCPITTEKRTHIIYVYIIMPTYYKYGYKFVAPSNTEHKKYDVYDVKTDKKIASFGDRRYEHYHDKIGYYSHLNTNNTARRKLYKMRHEKDRHVNQSAGWFADRYLW